MEEDLVKVARKIDDSVTVDPPLQPGRTLTIDISAFAVVKVLLVLLGAWALLQVWPLLTLLIVSLMLAAALSPYLALLERHGFSRTWSLTTVGVTIVVGFAAISAILVPGLILQTRSLIAHSNEYAASLQAVLAQHGMHVGVVHLWKGMPARLSHLDGKILPVLQTVLDSGIALATVLFVTLYVLSDQERLKAFFVGFFPARRRVEVLKILAELRRQVGGYVRGQLITSGLAMLFSFIVLVIAGVPNPITLAVYVGLADLVPMFGGLLGTVPAVLIALTISPLRAAIVLAGFILYQQIENHYIVPRVYSRTMKVSPLVALVALLVGARLLGILGMLVALPAVAALPVVLDFAGIHLHVVDRPEPEADAATDVA